MGRTTNIGTRLPCSYIGCLNPTALYRPLLLCSARPVFCILRTSDIMQGLCHDVRCMLQACWHCCSQTQHSKNAPETFWNAVRWPLQSLERSELVRGPTRIFLSRSLSLALSVSRSLGLSLSLIESWDYARPVIVVVLAPLSWLMWREGEREMCRKCVYCYYKNAMTKYYGQIM